MNQDTVNLIKNVVAQNQSNVTDYTELLAVAETGWQTDQATIDAGIKAGIDAAVTAATDPLNAQIAELQKTNENLNAQISDLNAQIAALTPAPATETTNPA